MMCESWFKGWRHNPASSLEALANELNIGGGPTCPMRAQHLLRAAMKALRGHDYAGDLEAAHAAGDEPTDRPTEAVAQLRDISEWLRAEGESTRGDDADELADRIAEKYGVE